MASRLPVVLFVNYYTCNVLNSVWEAGCRRKKNVFGSNKRFQKCFRKFIVMWVGPSGTDYQLQRIWQLTNSTGLKRIPIKKQLASDFQNYGKVALWKVTLILKPTHSKTTSAWVFRSHNWSSFHFYWANEESFIKRLLTYPFFAPHLWTPHCHLKWYFVLGLSTIWEASGYKKSHVASITMSEWLMDLYLYHA